MKPSMPLRTLSLLAATLLAAVSASAFVVIDTVPVGDPGNAADTSGYGAVSYSYRIGTYEVTNEQYSYFLNVVAASDPYGLWNAQMASTVTGGGIDRSGFDGSYVYTVKSGKENHPVNCVTFWNATRFTNWLTTGNTETGVYNLGGVVSPDNASIVRDMAAFLAGGIAVASQDEWYKAAYYDPTKNGIGGYWLHATQSDLAPIAEAPVGGNNSANYDGAVGGLTNAGAYAFATSYYGTFDQAGNAREWTDTITFDSRVIRGGAYGDNAFQISSQAVFQLEPDCEDCLTTFRITVIPEPSAYAALLGGLGLLLAFWRRRR